MDSKNRIKYLDALRVVAAIAVIMLHTSAECWGQRDVASLEQNVFTIYDSCVRWAVPVFLMISGALFLGQEVPWKILYKKYIFRMIVAFVVWSSLYAVHSLIGGGGLKEFVRETISSHYHLWYIPMIIGMYMCHPILRRIVEDKKVTEYFLILSFAFTFAIPWGTQLANDFAPDRVKNAVALLNGPINSMSLHLVIGYTFYYIMGYYLSQNELTPRIKTWIYIFGVGGFLLTVLLSIGAAYKAQMPMPYFSNFHVNILCEALFVFVWFKDHCKQMEKTDTILYKLSKYSFGVYLVHALILEQLNNRLGLNTLSFNPIISVPVITGIVFAIALVISIVLNHIPKLNKYIV